MILKVLPFDDLKGIVEFINENEIPHSDLQDIFREGTGYKLLFWTKKVKSR